jgi:hypothetical protein
MHLQFGNLIGRGHLGDTGVGLEGRITLKWLSGAGVKLKSGLSWIKMGPNTEIL